MLELLKDTPNGIRPSDHVIIQDICKVWRKQRQQRSSETRIQVELQTNSVLKRCFYTRYWTFFSVLQVISKMYLICFKAPHLLLFMFIDFCLKALFSLIYFISPLFVQPVVFPSFSLWLLSFGFRTSGCFLGLLVTPVCCTFIHFNKSIIVSVQDFFTCTKIVKIQQ